MDIDGNPPNTSGETRTHADINGHHDNALHVTPRADEICEKKGHGLEVKTGLDGDQTSPEYQSKHLSDDLENKQTDTCSDNLNKHSRLENQYLPHSNSADLDYSNSEGVSSVPSLSNGEVHKSDRPDATDSTVLKHENEHIDSDVQRAVTSRHDSIRSRSSVSSSLEIRTSYMLEKGATWPLAEGEIRFDSTAGSYSQYKRRSPSSDSDSSCVTPPSDYDERSLAAVTVTPFPVRGKRGDDDDEEGDEENTFSVRSLSRNQLIILVCTSVTNLISFLSLSILAPFFPLEVIHLLSAYIFVLCVVLLTKGFYCNCCFCFCQNLSIAFSINILIV